jgi:hypothetical protein
VFEEYWSAACAASASARNTAGIATLAAAVRTALLLMFIA